jgi:hypothetical protein
MDVGEAALSLELLEIEDGIFFARAKHDALMFGRSKGGIEGKREEE